MRVSPRSAVLVAMVLVAGCATTKPPSSTVEQIHRADDATTAAGTQVHSALDYNLKIQQGLAELRSEVRK